MLKADKCDYVETDQASVLSVIARMRNTHCSAI